ncbi:Rx, N-terminal [Dillenia turbinata]|uniref:Rx, N-terminal n=1 Tax=Dillenia turbinata TaxID=194707 RepID=A0AAN8WDS8_9MAGN
MAYLKGILQMIKFFVKIIDSLIVCLHWRGLACRVNLQNPIKNEIKTDKPRSRNAFRATIELIQIPYSPFLSQSNPSFPPASLLSKPLFPVTSFLVSAMGEPLLAAYLQTLLDKLDSGPLLNFARQEGFRSELRTWRSKLLQVRRVLCDAEEKQISDTEVKKWLDNLGDLAYYADDVLEELRHEALQRQNNSSSDSASSSSQVQDLLAQIQEITTSFLDIEEDKNDLGLKERPGVRSSIINNRLPTTSLVDSSQVVGRKKDIDAILKLLDIGEVFEDALVINLMNKKNIEELKFEWSRNLENTKNAEGQAQILNLLEPPKMLRNLVIEGYRGVTLPNWIGDCSYSKLVELSLIDCKRCKSLPSLSQLPLLQKLTIKGMLEIDTIGTELYDEAFPHGQPFPSLTELRIEECKNLRTLPDGIIGSNSNLQVLEIGACESLESFSSGVLPSTLKKLYIWDCRKLESISEMLLGPTSLYYVYFHMYPNLKNLPECPSTNLTYLCIDRCESIESFLETPNLAHLEIRYCENLKCLPSNLPKLTSLVYLRVEGCDNLVSLPEGAQESQFLLPPILTSLIIQGLPNLESLSSPVFSLIKSRVARSFNLCR